MTPTERRRARVAALRLQARDLERELARVRRELRRAEIAAVVTLHRGRGIPAPDCAVCGRPTRWMRGAWACPRCGSPVERVEATR